MKKQLFEIAFISAIITENYLPVVMKTINVGAIGAMEAVAEQSIKIFRKHKKKMLDKKFDWAEYCHKRGVSDYEEFVLEEFKKIIHKSSF